MHRPGSARVSRAGVNAVERAVLDLGWAFREQFVEDFGIDAQVEVVDGETPTGKLLALQIKSGASFFREPAPGGWWYRPDAAHVKYWTGHSLHVAVILHDPDTGLCHWQLIDSDLLAKTEAGGWKMLIPAAHVLGEQAREPLADAARVPNRKAARAYLERLAAWLDEDPWPQDARFEGPALVPSQIERTLRIRGRREEEDQDGEEKDQDAEADELCDQCSRLVVLGDSGTGKTWLARRAARRCALAALVRLDEGASLDEVELPLFTTCARLTAMPAELSIRDAIVRSALSHLSDLGGTQMDFAVRELFADRSAPVLVVLDSLDEAAGPDDRIRQADTLPPGWRVILTSRPSSWNRQLAVGGAPARRKGTLLPLRYPEDVEAFIAGWFADKPAWGADLTAQLRDGPDLKEAAGVPLILTFYCIIGGRVPLPARTADLYDKVIARMLTGRWRGSAYQGPDDLRACLATLRAWAWQAAECDPVSGLGAWADEFSTVLVRNPADRAALDNVATPQGPPDPDTGEVKRRFVHRSIQEHLVAKHVATLGADEAADALIGHLWYDPDWQRYAAHQAIALHPKREPVLRGLVQRVIARDEFPGDILAVGDGTEIPALLSRLAEVTAEADWSPEAATLIICAIKEYRGWEGRSVASAGSWPSVNDLTRRELAGSLPELLGELDADPPRVPGSLSFMVKAKLGMVDVGRLRAAIFEALPRASEDDVFELASLAGELAPTAAERADAREHVICALADPRSFASGDYAVRVLADLIESSEERAQVVGQLIELVKTSGGFRRNGFVSPDDHGGTVKIASVISQLAPAPEPRQTARAILLARLATVESLDTALDLCEALAKLNPTAGERAEAFDALSQYIIREGHLDMLREAAAYLDMPGEIARVIAPLMAGDHDRRRMRAILTEETARQVAERNFAKVRALTGLIAALDPTRDERARVTQWLLAALGAESAPEAVLDLAEAGMSLTARQVDPVEEGPFRALAFNATLALCAGWTPPQEIGGGLPQTTELFDSLINLADSADQRACCLGAVLDVLSRQEIDHVVQHVGDAVRFLADEAENHERLRMALLPRLDDAKGSNSINFLVELLLRLVHERADREHLRAKLLSKIGGQAEMLPLLRAARVIKDGDSTGPEKAQARKVLLKSFPGDSGYLWDESPVWQIVAAIGKLAADESAKAEVRRALLTSLHEHDVDPWFEPFSEYIVALSPVVADLDALGVLPCGLTVKVLAAMRRSAPVDAWLAALPKLTTPKKYG